MPSSVISKPTEYLDFEKKRHLYWAVKESPILKMRPLLSVTGVIDDNGLVWEGSKTEEDSARGIYVHEATVLMDEGDLYWPSVPDEYRGYLESWGLYKERTGCRILKSEGRVWDPLYGVAGTYDRILLYPNRMIPQLEDLKTTKKKAPPPFHTRYQTAGYEKMHRREFGGEELTRGGICLRADGGMPITREYNDPSDWSDFLSMIGSTKIRRRHNRGRFNRD